MKLDGGVEEGSPKTQAGRPNSSTPKSCGARIWEEGPICGRPASYKSVSEFFEGREAYFCARHAEGTRAHHELKLIRL